MANGRRPKQEIMPAERQQPLLDLEKLTPEERERVTKAYVAGAPGSGLPPLVLPGDRGSGL